MQNNYLITRAYHDEDNFWQFFNDISTNSNQNILIVGLGEVLKLDSSITDILDIPTGYYATRKSKNSD